MKTLIPTAQSLAEQNRKNTIRYIKVEQPHLDVNQHILKTFNVGVDGTIDQIVDVDDNQWQLLIDNELHTPTAASVSQLQLLADFIAILEEHRLTVLSKGKSPKTLQALREIQGAIRRFSTRSA